MKNIPQKPTQICPECRELINDLVDHRMAYDTKQQFMQRIARCKKEKNCYICVDLIKSFFTVRKNIQSLKSNVNAPDWLMKKILEKIS